MAELNNTNYVRPRIAYTIKNDAKHDNHDPPIANTIMQSPTPPNVIVCTDGIVRTENNGRTHLKVVRKPRRLSAGNREEGNVEMPRKPTKMCVCVLKIT